QISFRFSGIFREISCHSWQAFNHKGNKDFFTKKTNTQRNIAHAGYAENAGKFDRLFFALPGWLLS
ncbi:MAG TPA: hypothetical protein PKA77_09715, partial [Chitinophagaceae bacterium]|nr:hypothetical protein [Chitinophagaceae bacterium]